jgi:hypothetical protein
MIGIEISELFQSNLFRHIQAFAAWHGHHFDASAEIFDVERHLAPLKIIKKKPSCGTGPFPSELKNTMRRKCPPVLASRVTPLSPSEAGTIMPAR